MSLTIAPAAGHSNPFTAFMSPLSSTSRSPVFFGTTLLEIRASAVAEFVEVSMNVAAGAGLALSGPTRIASVSPGDVIPVGVVCNVRRSAGSLTPLTSMITVSWLNPGSTTRVFTQFSVVANLSGAPQVLFMATPFAALASPSGSRQFRFTLTCHQQIAGFSLSAFPAASAFSARPSMPAGAFVAGASARFDVSFDSRSGLDRRPQVLTVTATAPNGQAFAVPLICWCVDGPNTGDIAIVAIDSDPVGADLASESITIRNTTTRRLDLSGCSIRDEGGGPNGTFPMQSPARGFTFSPGTILAPGGTFRIFSGPGTNTPTELFLRLAKPLWNNDFDTAVMTNSAGDEIARRFYFTSLAGARISGQTKIFDQVLMVDQAMGFASTNVTLEDGDFVAIEPNPAVHSWAGEWATLETGPAGAAAPAPDTGNWPLPGAPKFALLADTARPILIGGNFFSQVVNRTSSLRAGDVLDLQINDDAPGGFLAWGRYDARVRVFRK